MRYSNGNTLPMTQMPFGMGGFAPQTASNRGAWYFHPDDRCLEGVRLTHQPSPWLSDYGAFVFMPQEGAPLATPDHRWSGYRPGEAIMRPDYLKLDFKRYNTIFELTPGERSACMRLDYYGQRIPRFAILPVEGMYHFEVDAKNRRIIGWTDHSYDKTANNFKMHIVLEFDCDFDIENTVITLADGSSKCGQNITEHNAGLNVALLARQVCVRMASSYISPEQALLNLEQECTGSFDAMHNKALSAWEAKLSLIKADFPCDEMKRTFYSCLCRSFLYPHKSYEIDKAGLPVHYCALDGNLKQGETYTNNGFWDTFRTVYPLLSIIDPDSYAAIVKGYIQIYKDTGWLPRWPALGEFGCMPGTLIDAVIADAAVKGILTGDWLETAFEGMLKHSKVKADNPKNGRVGVEEYNQYGYVPRHIRESVNNSLDSHYGDFCIAQVAKVLGKHDIEKEYLARSQGYKILFDQETGFIRGLGTDGSRKSNFNPTDWGDEYTEGSAWQCAFGVYHDIDGLADLYGGADGLERKLDELFATPPQYYADHYGMEIHEMTEMAAVDFGQCAISNQPSYHIPYLYAAIGKQEKTDHWVGKIINELFSAEADGFPGDEDNGTMAAWYVLSCIGVYQICPGKTEYVKVKTPLHNIKVNGKPWL